MALAPGETHETFIREVDENLRRSQAENFFKRFGKWLIAALVLFLVATAAYLYWQERQRARAAAQGEQFAAVLNDISTGRTGKPVEQKLQAIAAESSGEMAGLARLTVGALALQNGDRSKAVTSFQAVANDDDQPQSVRTAALMRQTALEFDQLGPDQVIARLQPYATPDSPWFGTAGELTAMAMLKAGRKAQAGQLFGRIADAKDVPGSIRARALQIAGSLGVDATAGLPAGQ
ncbi:tetratricopeptide repeat protein [Sphingomonas sp. BN140010]|uniref:Tetratricopeptide repeat protein n=1 Tax=Sphingomonas arvum TaxID=2992113 RepID=A0ABT3JGU9_9SPHN|nr:tetratricopeptide repeat protein [Sphingomonas sp. BN140010]MCW3798302.1 tetratricopeptide repeat protein [Sphingomonas sp. BN140010]